MSKIKEAIKRAQGDVDALQAKVGYWAQIVDAKRAELAELEASVGRRVADDDTGKALQDYAAEKYGLAAQIEGARGAVEEFEGRLRTAQLALKAAQAAEMREQAAALRAEAEKRQARVDELLAALREYEGGDWRPWEPTQQDVVQAGAAGIPLAPRNTPPMVARADELDRQATRLEEEIATEQRRTSAVVPNARIVWDPSLPPSEFVARRQQAATVSCGVTDGLGSADFEVVRNGQIVDRVTLPESGRLGRRKVYEGLQGDVFEVRCAGRVLASTAAADALVSH